MTEVCRERFDEGERLILRNDLVSASLLVQNGACSVEVVREGEELSSAFSISSQLSLGRSVLGAFREDEGAAEAIVGGILPATASSWEFRVRVADGSSAIEAECRWMNRLCLPMCDEPVWTFDLLDNVERVPGGIACLGKTGGIAIGWDERAVRLKTQAKQFSVVPRFASAKPCLFPHRMRVLRFTVFLVPKDAGDVASLSGRAMVTWNRSDGKLCVFVVKDEPAGMAFLQLANGVTVEAPLHAYAAKPAVFSTSGLGAPPVRALLRDEQGAAMLDAPFDKPEEVEGRTLAEPTSWDEAGLLIRGALRSVLQGDVDGAERDLLLLAAEPGWESISWFLLGAMAMRKHRWDHAMAYLDESLLYGGANPIAWVFRAWCVRQMGGDATQDISNAHWIAPTDPLLRIDSFLEGGGEGLLDDFGADSEPFLDAAEFLWLAGKEAERNAVLAAAADRAPSKLVHALRSEALTRSGFELEAALELERASSAPGSPTGVRIGEQLLINSR